MQINDSTTAPKIQVHDDGFLHDTKPTSGKGNDWDYKKTRSSYLSMMMDGLPGVSASKVQRVGNCGNFLVFGQTKDYQMKLLHAFFCKDRLCPVCTWRRSMRTFHNTMKILEYIGPNNYQYIFLTLTIKNVKGDVLKQAIDDMLKAIKRMTNRKIWRTIVKGYYRGIEVTRNSDPHDKNYGTFHPHVHFLLVVSKGYGHHDDYLSKDKWAELWRSCMRLDYQPVCDVRKVRPKKSDDTDDIHALINAVCEATKYPTKDNEVIDPENVAFSRESIKYLMKALRGRRLVHYGGVLEKAQQELKLVDAEEAGNDELIHTSDEDEKEDFIIQRCYGFNYGFMRYRHYKDIPWTGDKDIDRDARERAEGDYYFDMATDKQSCYSKVDKKSIR